MTDSREAALTGETRTIQEHLTPAADAEPRPKLEPWYAVAWR